MQKFLWGVCVFAFFSRLILENHTGYFYPEILTESECNYAYKILRVSTQLSFDKLNISRVFFVQIQMLDVMVQASEAASRG